MLPDRLASREILGPLIITIDTQIANLNLLLKILQQRLLINTIIFLRNKKAMNSGHMSQDFLDTCMLFQAKQTSFSILHINYHFRLYFWFLDQSHRQVVTFWYPVKLQGLLWWECFSINYGRSTCIIRIGSYWLGRRALSYVSLRIVRVLRGADLPYYVLGCNDGSHFCNGPCVMITHWMSNDMLDILMLKLKGYALTFYLL